MLSKLLPDSVSDWVISQYPWQQSADTWRHTLALSTTGVVGLSVIWYLWKRYQDRGVPPGPTGWPLVGCRNLLEGWTYQDDLTKLGDKYGDIFSVQKGPNLLVVLNSYAYIKEAFIDQGDLFACRPYDPVTVAMKLQDEVFSTPYETPCWNENKNTIIACIRAAGFGARGAVEDKVLEQVQLLTDHLDQFAAAATPLDVMDLLQKATVNVIFQVVTSQKYDYDDPKLDKIFKMVRNHLSSFDEMVNFNTMPQWLVKIVYRKRIQTIFSAAEALRDIIREEITQHMDTLNPEEPRDFIDIYLIKTGGKRPMAKMIDNILVLLPDASETVALSLAWAFLYITHHQDVQDKIAAEITALTGGNRYVTWADKKNLPYTEAALTEVMRIEPTVTTSVAHSTSKDVIFHGFRIPPRAHVYANLRAAHKDPRLFDDPEVFKPERFIAKDGGMLKPEGWIPFSMGRRKCVGESITRIELFLFTANIIQKYRMTFPDGPQPTLDAMRNIIAIPYPYKVIITHRD